VPADGNELRRHTRPWHASAEQQPVCANLNGCVLSHAALTDLRLTEASLRGADLRGADLAGSVLLNADLYAAKLKGADLRGATLDRSTSTGWVRCPVPSSAALRPSRSWSSWRTSW